jgi:hypothetical protein
MFASVRKTRRARYNLCKINLKMKVLSKAAYHWRKRIVTSTRLERQKKKSFMEIGFRSSTNFLQKSDS